MIVFVGWLLILAVKLTFWVHVELKFFNDLSRFWGRTLEYTGRVNEGVAPLCFLFIS